MLSNLSTSNQATTRSTCTHAQETNNDAIIHVCDHQKQSNRQVRPCVGRLTIWPCTILLSRAHTHTHTLQSWASLAHGHVHNPHAHTVVRQLQHTRNASGIDNICLDDSKLFDEMVQHRVGRRSLLRSNYCMPLALALSLSLPINRNGSIK
jgi:hypothetical protein